MSIERCERHSRHWDSDFVERCPLCLEEGATMTKQEQFELCVSVIDNHCQDVYRSGQCFCSDTTHHLQAECMRLSKLQRKAKGACYYELDAQWTRIALELMASRVQDASERGRADIAKAKAALAAKGDKP